VGIETVNAAMDTGNTMALQLIQHETICSIFNNFTVTELYVICVPLNLPVCVLNPEFHICSPDSTLLDFCIFRHLQNEVFKWRIHTLDELMEEITNCFNTIEQQMYNFTIALSTFSVKLVSTVDINPKMCFNYPKS
jgi:hypothetical protein